eukprot:11166897-Lingulodinium_polyedra.AAC.1
MTRRAHRGCQEGQKSSTPPPPLPLMCTATTNTNIAASVMAAVVVNAIEHVELVYVSFCSLRRSDSDGRAR